MLSFFIQFVLHLSVTELFLKASAQSIKCAVLSEQRCNSEPKCIWYNEAGCRETCQFLSQEGCSRFEENGCLWEENLDSQAPGQGECLVLYSETQKPTLNPTKFPSSQPSLSPVHGTKSPTKPPTSMPTFYPTEKPTPKPLNEPTLHPTEYPSKYPTAFPTGKPTPHPTNYPSDSPTFFPLSPEEASSVIEGLIYIGPSGIQGTNGFLDPSNFFNSYAESVRELLLISFRSHLYSTNPENVQVLLSICDKDSALMTTYCERYFYYLDINPYKDNTGFIPIGFSISPAGGVHTSETAALKESISNALKSQYNVEIFEFHVTASSQMDDDIRLANPNVLFILADDLGWGDVGYQSCEALGVESVEGLCTPKALTPNVNSLAESENTAVFNRFYTTPQCGPSRSSFLTGREPIRECNLFNIFRTPPEGEDPLVSPLNCVKTMAEFLSEADGEMHSIHLGKWHLGKLHKVDADGNPTPDEPNYTLSAPEDNGFYHWLSSPRHGATMNMNCGCGMEYYGTDESTCEMGMYDSSFLWELYEQEASDGSTQRKYSDLNMRDRFSCENYWGNLEGLSYDSQDQLSGFWPEKIIQEDSEFLYTKFENFLSGIYEGKTTLQKRKTHFFAMLAFHTPHAPFVATSEDYEEALKLITQDDNSICGWIFDRKFEAISDQPDCEEFLDDIGRGTSFEDGLTCSEVCRRIKAHYYGSIIAFDREVGKLRDLLEVTGVSKNTVIVFASDNGPARHDASRFTKYIGPGSTSHLLEWKLSAHEGGTRVPFFIHAPALIKENRIIDTMASSYDVLPTLLEILNVRYDQGKLLDGVSLLPYLIEGKLEREKPIAIVTSDIDFNFLWKNFSVIGSPNYEKLFYFSSELNRLIEYEEKEELEEAAREAWEVFSMWKATVYESSPCKEKNSFPNPASYCNLGRYKSKHIDSETLSNMDQV